jgi:hypothetical protein
MSDIKLFHITNGSVQELQGTSIAIERWLVRKFDFSRRKFCLAFYSTIWTLFYHLPIGCGYADQFSSN